MKFLDLFAGIGGFRLGLERAGHECVGYVEWDKYARKSYEAIHNTEGEWTRNDITSVTDNEWRELRGKVDIIAGGFPCQSFSIAGKREGFADKTKGTLFFEIVRAAKQIQPQFLFLENVKGLLNHDKGNTFRTILSTLDELGYDAEWQLLNSKDFGVPQNRERVFIIGHLRNGRGREVFPIEGSYGSVNQNDIKAVNDSKKIREQIGFESVNRFYDVEGISPCLNTMSGGGREPKIMIGASRGRNPNNPSDRRMGSPTEQRLEINQDGVSNTLTTVQKDNYVVQEIGSNFYCKDDVVLTEKQLKNNESFFEPSYIYIEPIVLRIGNHKLLLINQDLTQVESILVGENHCLSEWVSFDEKYINSLLSLEPKEKFGRMGKQAVETFNENECEFGDTINPFNKTIDKSGFSPTLTTRPEGFKTAILPITNDFRIRKLTPLECFRLQGFPDEAFRAAEQVNSNSQLYKQAGNSVTVNVIEAIAKRF